MVAFTLWGFEIHRYGIFYFIAFVVGYFFLTYIGKTKLFKDRPNLQNILEKGSEDIILYCLLGVIIGGRLGHIIIYGNEYYFSHLTEIFQIWKWCINDDSVAYNFNILTDLDDEIIPSNNKNLKFTEGSITLRLIATSTRDTPSIVCSSQAREMRSRRAIAHVEPVCANNTRPGKPDKMQRSSGKAKLASTCQWCPEA